MTSEDGRLVEKIAFCSVLCAGFAYAGYNVVSKMCYKKSRRKENSFSQTMIEANASKLSTNKATQTDGLSKSKYELEDRCISPISVKERVNDLNMLTDRLRKNSIPISPEVKPHSFHGSPWSSPLGCAKYLSVSAENISSRCSALPECKDKSP
ncbi:hypothetical protein X975_23296, partial [Stegodyphus mimosarum]